jgi:hypothetical protein
MLLRVVLVIMAILIFAGGCAVAALTLWDANEHPGAAVGRTVSIAVGAILLGGLFALVALAMASILGYLERSASRAAVVAPAEDHRPALGRIEQSLRMINTAQTRGEPVAAGVPAQANATAGGGGGGANVGQLAELMRDLALMSDAQRQRFAARHWLRRRDAFTEIIERNVLVGDWNGAFARLDDLQLLLPEDPQVKELRERVESEQNSRMEEDLRGARAQVRRFIGTASWQQAEEVAADLQRKYANKPNGSVLVDEVRREREAWDRENMERLFRDIAAATERRQWRQAVLATEEFIRRYPNEVRAEALRLDLPTLTENAAAQERREQEAHFKDLLKHQRYNEAIGVARAVIQKYPNSPTATELNKLLPRVEELARQAAATPQQPTPPAPPAPAAPAPATANA